MGAACWSADLTRALAVATPICCGDRSRTHIDLAGETWIIMAEYQGYTIKQNPDTGKWEIFWQDRKQEGEYARQADAEEWIDDQFPLNR